MARFQDLPIEDLLNIGCFDGSPLEFYGDMNGKMFANLEEIKKVDRFLISQVRIQVRSPRI